MKSARGTTLRITFCARHRSGKERRAASVECSSLIRNVETEELVGERGERGFHCTPAGTFLLLPVSSTHSFSHKVAE